jgi:enoyl-CoA hydratase/carnithine racemase
MPTYENIRLAIDDRVARITFCRQPLNIFNIAMMKEINAALTTLSQEILVAIVFDADKDCRAFSAGVAVEDHDRKRSIRCSTHFTQSFAHLSSWQNQLLRLSMGRHWVVAVNSSQLATSLSVQRRGKFGQPEVKLGVFPPVAALLLPSIIGDKRARELILTGEIIDAVEAGRLRLCNHVVPVCHLEQKLMEVSRNLESCRDRRWSFHDAHWTLGAAKH